MNKRLVNHALSLAPVFVMAGAALIGSTCGAQSARQWTLSEPGAKASSSASGAQLRMDSPWNLYSATGAGGCPVAMQAHPGVGAGTMIVRDRAASSGIAQRLHVTLTNQMPQTVVGVTILVHGLRNRTRMTPTIEQATAQTTGKISRVVQLDLSMPAEKDASTEVVLDAFTSVSRVDLLTVSYQDGTEWQSEAMSQCHVIPDGFMLVAGR